MAFVFFGKKDDRTPGKVLRTVENKYGTYVVKNGTYRGEEARLYEVDGTRESATFFDDRKYDLVFDYMKAFRNVIEENPEIKRVLMLGGAGFQFPKFFVKNYPDKIIHVVEINPLSIHLARKYFFLNDLEKDFGAESSGRLKIILGDGADYLKTTKEEYDIIINDAYHSNIADPYLTSAEGTSLIKSRLTEGGIYCLNLITSLEGRHSMPFNFIKSSFCYQFKNVGYILCTPSAKPEASQNVVFMGRD